MFISLIEIARTLWGRKNRNDQEGPGTVRKGRGNSKKIISVNGVYKKRVRPVNHVPGSGTFERKPLHTNHQNGALKKQSGRSRQCMFGSLHSPDKNARITIDTTPCFNNRHFSFGMKKPASSVAHHRIAQKQKRSILSSQ
jgi:hypothetical protein